MADKPLRNVSPRLAIVLAADRRLAGLGLLFRSQMLATAFEVGEIGHEVLLPGLSGLEVRHEISTRHGAAGLQVLEIGHRGPDVDDIRLDEPRAGQPCTVAAFDGETVSILSGHVATSDGDAFTIELEAELAPGSVAAGSPVMVAGSFVGILGAGISGRAAEGIRIDAVVEGFRNVTPVPTDAPEDEAPLSDRTRRALGFAASLLDPPAQGRPPGVLSAAALIGALRLSEGQQQGSVPSALLVFLGRRASGAGSVVERAAAAIDTQALSDLGAPLTDERIDALGFGPLVARAGEYARRIGRSSSVHRRHLVAAAFNDPEPAALRQMLGVFDVRLDELGTEIQRALVRLQPDEPAEIWASILELELEGGITADAVDARKGIDLEDDHLGVGDYVTMLATVIADSRTPMPLSIGLFGEWGSGKSYFMGLLRKQVDELREQGGDYCEDIQHIAFNAWHYADSNLWASLGDEIFEQLAGPRENDANTRRAALRRELSEKLQRRKELTAATERAQQESAQISKQLDEARAQRETSARTLAKAVANSESLREKLADAGRKLGLKQTDQIALLAGELRGAADDLGVVRRVLTGRHRYVLAAAGVVIVALVVAALVLGAPRWLLGGGFATLAVIGTIAGLIAARARAGLAIVHEIAEGVRAQAAEGTADEEAQLRDAEAKESVLEAQQSTVTEQVGELGRELAELAPGQRLYRFVVDRAEGNEYTRHLGLISTVRKDFEQLTILMDEWRKDKGEGARKPIDRIVLYIDDLDRCSPRQVVDVLQAVHLLLAMKLFVVVVGVDPRWLLRSLQREYRSVLTSEDGRNGDDETWLTTPQDYLEKIFNIPFSLPSIRQETFKGLLEGFVKQPAATGDEADAKEQSEAAAESSAGAGTEDSPPPASGEEEQASPPEGEDGRSPEPVSAERGSEVAAAQSASGRPQPEPLTKQELDLLALLAPLVPTPREAKRLFNLYRMVRSTQSFGPASSFLGSGDEPGEYQAVVILLGMLSGHGRLLESVLAAAPEEDVRLGGLLRCPDGTKWNCFAAGMRPRCEKGRWTNEVVGEIAEADVDGWRRLADGLAPVTASVTLDDLGAFKRWAPLIARFSFLLSPLASEVRSDDPLPETRSPAPVA